MSKHDMEREINNTLQREINNTLQKRTNTQKDINKLEKIISQLNDEMKKLERNVNYDPNLTDGYLSALRMASREARGKITPGKKYNVRTNGHARGQLRDRIDEQQGKLKEANTEMVRIQTLLGKLKDSNTPGRSNSNYGYRPPNVKKPRINLGNTKLAGRTGGARTRLRSRLGRGNSGKNKKKMKKTKKKMKKTKTKKKKKTKAKKLRALNKKTKKNKQ